MDDSCELCRLGRKSRNHIFFTCPFSQELLKIILPGVGLRKRPVSWPAWWAWIMRIAAEKSSATSFRRQLNAILVYELWKERNNRAFKMEASSPESLGEKIIRQLI